jgi:hypothetical protein
LFAYVDSAVVGDVYLVDGEIVKTVVFGFFDGFGDWSTTFGAAFNMVG